jgi:hypothetical protein
VPTPFSLAYFHATPSKGGKVDKQTINNQLQEATSNFLNNFNKTMV